MKINWKARFKNKAFLITFIPLVIAFVYQVLGLFDVVPSISENEILELLSMAVNILAFVGVIVDPTTEGIKDSDRAMLYYTDYDERMLDE